jgi:3-deoxy-D-manno-octulosonic-acid transferase
MSDRWARTLMGGYRWAGAAAYPFVGGYMAWRASQGVEDRGRRRERYGYGDKPRPAGPLVWVHAVNESETLAVTGLIGRILALGLDIVLTTGTIGSARVARERLGDRVVHQYAPLDLKPAVSRFLDHWRPDLAIIAESEIWPMTILELGARRVPMVLVNGRMSQRAFEGWRKWPSLAEALLENLSLVSAQSEQDAERFTALGARPVAISGSLKTDIDPPPVDELEMRRVFAQIGKRKCWAALCTHPGEELAAGEAHKKLKARFADVLTVIMPRDAARSDAIEAELVGLGLTVARRSRGDKVTDKIDVLLGDKEERGLYVRLVDIAFYGGSMFGGGGENPIEAVVLGSAVLCGPDYARCADIYDPLIAKGGVRLVKERELLAGALNHLMRNDDARHRMIDAGTKALEQMRGALDNTMRGLEPFIHPLVVKAKLGSATPTRR